MSEVDDGFYDRADAHIHLSNDHISKDVGRGKSSASMMYATARFNAWVSATGWASSEEMEESKEDTVEYFVAEYRKMLLDNMDDYIENFEKYIRAPKRDE